VISANSAWLERACHYSLRRVYIKTLRRVPREAPRRSSFSSVVSVISVAAFFDEPQRAPRTQRGLRPQPNEKALTTDYTDQHGWAVSPFFVIRVIREIRGFIITSRRGCIPYLPLVLLWLHFFDGI
jgi:hypothetical protein